MPIVQFKINAGGGRVSDRKLEFPHLLFRLEVKTDVWSEDGLVILTKLPYF